MEPLFQYRCILLSMGLFLSHGPSPLVCLFAFSVLLCLLFRFVFSCFVFLRFQFAFAFVFAVCGFAGGGRAALGGRMHGMRTMVGRLGMDVRDAGVRGLSAVDRRRLLEGRTDGLSPAGCRLAATLASAEAAWFHGLTVIRFTPMCGQVRYRVYEGELSAGDALLGPGARRVGEVRSVYVLDGRPWVETVGQSHHRSAQAALRVMLRELTGWDARIS